MASQRKRKLIIDPRYETPGTAAARKRLAASVHKVFVHQFAMVKEILGNRWPVLKVRKKAEDENLPEDEFEQILAEINSAISIYFKQLPVEATEALDDAIREGLSKGIAELGISDVNIINKLNVIARDWANSRAAEMVGMRYAADGGLIENPNARWVIGDTTRLRLRQIVREAFETDTPLGDVIESVQKAGLFEQWRAEMIARTEVAFAQANGNLEVWKKTGVVKSAQWFLSEDHDDSLGCDCEDNDGEIVPIGENFPSGDECPPAHPNCWCVIIAVDIEGEDEDESETPDEETDTEAEAEEE